MAIVNIGIILRRKSKEVSKAIGSIGSIRAAVLIKPLGLNVGFDAARNLIADASTFEQPLAKIARGDADRRDRHAEDRSRGGTEIRGFGQVRRVETGSVDHDERGDLGDPHGRSPSGEFGQTVRADKKKRSSSGCSRRISSSVSTL